jgi:hypothetical protein
LWDLETPAFRWTGHVKKGRAGVLYVLEANGPMRLEELAEVMGWSRPRDLRLRYVDPLVELGLVEERDGLLGLPEHHAELVEEVRRAPYTTVSRRRRESRDGDRTVRWVEEVENTASEVEREEKDLRAHEKQRENYQLHLARKSPEADEQCREVLNAWDEEREAGPTVPDGVDPETGEIVTERRQVPAERLDIEPMPDEAQVFGIACELCVPDGGAGEPDTGLVDALAGYLDLHPHRRSEGPSWLANYLWSEELFKDKPTAAEVGDALALLEMPA